MVDDGAQHFAEEVPEVMSGERVDRLVAVVADVSRREATSLIASGMVKVGGKPVRKGSGKVASGLTIEVTVPSAEPLVFADASVEVPVVYADQHMLVVNKPAGLIVHPGAGVRARTMVHGLLAEYPEIADVGEVDRPGVVHRLDKGTSGLLMVARNQSAYDELVDQLKARSVDRTYLALVQGHLASDSGTIDAPLGRSNRNATRQSVVMGGRTAITHYSVDSRHTFASPDETADAQEDKRRLKVSLLRCKLETGRTHQIRAHLSAIGHPVVGDDTYGGAGREVASIGLDRPFLHAVGLGFTHPDSGDPMAFSAELPPDLKAAQSMFS